jgi:hypothetical protein
MKVNHIFLRHFMTNDIQEPGMPTTESSHTYEFYKHYEKYECPVNPEFKTPIDFKISVTPQISYCYPKIEDVFEGEGWLNVVWVPMHFPTWRWFGDFYKEVLHDLEILADPNNPHKIAVVWDYNNETLFPGNFQDTETQIDILQGLDVSQFYCSTLSWNRTNVMDTVGFRQIISNYSCLGGLALFDAMDEDPSLKTGFRNLVPGKEYPIRYFCPNNVFRPNRAMGIVKMYHKGMLDDTEWSMNKFSQWHEMDRFIQITDTDFFSYVEEYFDLFGKTPRQMSHPWNKSFNLDRINQDRDDHSMKYKSWYDAFPHDLMDKVFIYIPQQTVTGKTTEEPINPLKPYYVGDWDEKILKGFLYCKPTLINGRAGTVKILEELGFDMLTDYYTYDYDSEQDDIVRIDKMLDCARNFPKPDHNMIARIDSNNKLVRSKEFWWNSQANLIQILLDNHS